jgi:Tol biopolymer transport system component
VLLNRRGVTALALLAGTTVVAAVLAPSSGAAASGSPALGGGTSAVLDLHEASALALAVSPDHRHVVLNFLDSLWTLPASGGTATRVTSLVQDTGNPDWSPDGSTVAFESYRTGTFHIWAMNPNGSKVRELTGGFYDDREPAYSPDGTKIAFSSDRPPAGSAPGTMGGSYNVWTLTLATGELTQVTHAARAHSDYYPTWSPDGRQIAFVNTFHEIDAVTVAGPGVSRVLYASPAATFYSPTWSPDGKSLAYTERTDLPAPATRLMVNGVPVSGNEDVFTFPARWISTGALLYAADGHILRRDVGAATVTTVPFTAKVPFNRPSYPMKQHDFASTSAQPTTGVVAPALSPDGRHVAFVALNQLWEMTVGQSPRRLTSDGYYKADPTWSPDGRYLAYATDRNGPMAIYIRDLRTGQVRKLTPPAGASTLSQAAMAWSPDGREIAFQSAVDNEPKAGTWVANVATGQIRLVLAAQFEPGRPTWSPDSTTLALAAWKPYSNRFREGVSLVRTVNVNTGVTRWYDPYPYQTITNRVDGDGPVWSPDGRYMAYVLDDVLWLLPVTPTGAPAGPARQVTADVADQISWSKDSRHILYDSAGQLRLVTVASGRSVAHSVAVPVRLAWRQTVPTTREVIHAGSLWAGTSDSLQHNVDIAVQNNRIVSVGPARPRRNYGPEVRYVDAAKLTVIPGLWDAHRHEQLDQPYAGGRSNRLELSFGITSVMSMGDAAYPALEETQSQQSGARLGPRYFWAAEPVDGRRIYYNFMRATPDQTALQRELSRLAQLKPDVLKTYVRLPNTMEAQAIAAGHQLGIPSFSHYFWPALAFGQDGTSHWATQRAYQNAVSNDTIAYNDTIALYARSGMAITNTPFSGVQFVPGLLNDPRLKTLLSPWQYANAEKQYAAGPETPAGLALQRGWGQADAKILKAGGTVLAGTDASLGLGDFGQVVAMSVMAHTGLTNYQVLQSATVSPAKVMGVADQLGTIQPGMLADMDIIRGNPLADINAITNDVYVMQNGQLFTEQQLLAPYTNSRLNTPPTSAARTTARGGQLPTSVAAGTGGQATTSSDSSNPWTFGVAGGLALAALSGTSILVRRRKAAAAHS